MRSSSAHSLLKRASRIPQASLVIRRTVRPAIRNGYCSSCDSKSSATPVAKKVELDAATEKLHIPPVDHRQIGIEQDLFTTTLYSPGSPLFLPNGARIFNNLVDFLRAQYSFFGFQEVVTPTVYKRSLWEKSGHWENYADDMYSVIGRGVTAEREGKELQEDEEYGLKPMNCPGHCLIFASQQRSFRDLPIRYADFSSLHRNEISGALSGLTRVRRFHQDDGHIFCRPSQVRDEILKTLQFVKMAYKIFDLGAYRLALSTRPKDHFIGTMEEWEAAEAALSQALNDSEHDWTINEGDGAFYGPKIDVILKDSDGKEHQTATIQLDFQLPKRFNLEYQAPAPEVEQKGLTTTDPELLSVSGPVRPVMIHRAVLGSLERFFALLIEHYAGSWPFWLNPRQIAVVTVNDTPDVLAYTESVVAGLQNDTAISGNGPNRQLWTAPLKPRSRSDISFAIDIDDSARGVGKKISEAKRKHYSIVLVVGPKNLENKTVTADLSGMLNEKTHDKLKSWLIEQGNDLGHTAKSGPGKLGDKFRAVETKPDALRGLLKTLENSYL